MEETYLNEKITLKNTNEIHGKVGWRSPSNIALVKYWGKYGVQLPKNPSISLTLDNAYSETIVKYSSRRSDIQDNVDGLPLVNFYFEGKENVLFANKIKRYLGQISSYFPFIKQLNFDINSHNSFPHSTGIASSASSMSALALCICTIEKEISGQSIIEDMDSFLQKASFMARLGSGSACRSVYPGAALWGETPLIEKSSNYHAIPFHLHEVYQEFNDTILLISKTEKAVSSRAGHALMDDNIFAENRYYQANMHLSDLINTIQSGDLDQFGEIVEREALALHALMMTSSPPYILMKPNTLEVINRIREFRKRTSLPLYFTLDAGPNLHLLYPSSCSKDVLDFIDNDLKRFCENESFIIDQVGEGSRSLFSLK